MSLASSQGQQSPSVRLPASQHRGSKESNPASSVHNIMSPASSLGHQSPSALLPASPRLPSKEKPPREDVEIEPKREWAWAVAFWIVIIVVSFVFAGEPSNGAYYRHKLYVKASAVFRRCVMALVKILLILACLTCLLGLTTLFAMVGWTLIWRFIQTCIIELTLPVIWVWRKLKNLLLIPMTFWMYRTWIIHPITQFMIAGWTLMWRFIQSCINKLKLPAIWVWRKLENLLLILMTCWKFFTWPMEASPSEWWRRMWLHKERKLDGKHRIEKLVVQDMRPQSRLAIFSWQKQQHLLNDWWRSMRQSRFAMQGFQPSLASGLKIVAFIIILIFLIWGILSSPTSDDWFWGFLNARL